VLCVGDGARRYAPTRAVEGGRRRRPAPWPRPSQVHWFTSPLLGLAAGFPTLGAADIHPLYLREADAVANFAERSGSRASHDDQEFKLVPMHRRRLRAVLDIERRIFPEPWSQGGVHLRAGAATGAVRTHGQAGHTLAGYMGMMFVEKRRT